MPLTSYPEALQALLAAATPLPAVEHTLYSAAGRVAARTVPSPGPVPRFRNAALDGYAVRAADLGGAATTLRVAGQALAGTAPTAPLAAGTALAITTGAPLPAGADTVVPVERSRVAEGADGAPQVVLEPGTAAGANVRGAGEDFAPGDPVVTVGMRLGPAALMALGAAGVATVAARGPVRVAVLTTGNEIHAAGANAGPGGVSDANGPYLAAFLPAAGAECVAWATAGDRLPDLVGAIERLRAGADVIVTTGGVSAGSHDLVPAAVAAAGGKTLFHKVAIRPGKPVLAARFADGGWLLGLPGNPIAVAVGARFFLVPLLRALRGEPPEAAVHARAASDLRARGGLLFFGKARARVGPDGSLTAAPLPGQESFRVAPLVAANCWLVVPPEPAGIRAGEPVQVVPLDPAGDWLAPGA